MSKKIIETDNAPKAIGPYSQAVVASNLMFISGQIAVDPTGNTAPSDIREQTRQVLLNLKAILESQGLTMDNVVKTTVYLSDMENFGQMNEEYAKFFTENPPARATVEVSRLPKDFLVEIDAIAVIQ